MQVRIRLQKAGKAASKRYNYRIVVISRQASRQSANLDILGYYDPSQKPALLSLNKEKLSQWVKKGAQMSDTVRSLANQLNKKG